jgi:hypothetical protein
MICPALLPARSLLGTGLASPDALGSLCSVTEETRFLRESPSNGPGWSAGLTAGVCVKGPRARSKEEWTGGFRSCIGNT